MYLKKLKIVGFKSFANSTEFIFDEGITAIVGPNGCGKSNVSDCIRWVLGEQSARSLRGTKMEDVIFTGTDSKKSLSMAEVSITFENSDRILLLDYDEITVTRRVFRSGESEYSINKNICRLKDIHELFYDTGIGTTAYSSLEQGKIDLILSTKPEDRKYVFEEAAGITKYKNKKKEALKKLEYTETNLIRLLDIIQEVKRQLNSINRQAAKARKFKDSHEELKSLDIKHSFTKYENIAKKVEHLTVKKTHLDEKEDHLTHTIQTNEESLSQFRTKYHNIDHILSQVHNKRVEIEKEKNNSEHKIRYNAKKLEDILQTGQRWKESITIIEHKITEYQNQIKDLEKELKSTQELKNKYETELQLQEKEHITINEEIKEKKALLSKKKNVIFDTTSREIKIKNKLTDLRIEEGHLKQLKEKFIKEIKQLIEEQKRFSEEVTTEESNINHKKEILTEHIKNIDKNTTKLILEKKRLKEVDEEIGQTQKLYSAKSSQKELLLEVKNNYEGFFNGVRAVMLKKQEDNFLKKEVEGVVADVIYVKPEYELAIEVAAGSKIQNIITSTDKAIAHAVNFLKKNHLGRATFLALNMVDAGKIYVPSDFLKDKNILGYAVDFIEFDKKYRSILNYVLGNCLIVEEIRSALDIAKKKKLNCNLVTLEGELINPQGAVTGGSMSKSGRGLLGRESHIKRLQKEILSLEKETDKKIKERNYLINSIEQRENDITQQSQNKHKIEIEIATLENSLEKIKQQQLELNKNKEIREIEIKEIDEKNRNNASKIKEINETLKKK